MDLSGVASLPEDFLEWKQSRRHLWLVFDREQVCEGIRHKVPVGQIVGHASNAPKGLGDPVGSFLQRRNSRPMLSERGGKQV